MNTDEEFKAELYRNRHEKIGDIPNDYIGVVKRDLENMVEFEISIPKYIQIKDKKMITPLYSKIKPMQHVIVTTTINGVDIKERFVLIQPRGNRSKNNGSKTFKAMSFEYTLKKKRTSFEGKVIQLKSDNIHKSEGILDKFTRETGWGIGYVDPKSRTELMSTTEKINVDLFTNYNKSSIVTDGGLLFEKNVTTTIANNRPLYISFEYTNLNTYSDGQLLFPTPSIYNTITDALYTNIKKIQAYHYSDVGNRYGIRYVFTLTDNTTVERIAVFTNVINKTFTCENIRLVWETGDIIETENVKYINIENLDTDWYEALKSLQDNFKSIFVFDSYNKVASVIHRDSLNEEAPYILSYDNAVIDIEVTENSDYITGLKAIGKDGLSIVSENIYGDDIVRNYSEYIRLGNMSEELQLALQRYETILTTKQEEWLGIKNLMITETQKQVRIDSEIQSLQVRIKEYKNLLAGYMSEKDTTNQSRIKGEIDDLETRLNQCLALRLTYKNNIDSLNDELMTISKSIDRNVVVDGEGKIFTSNDLAELNDIEQVALYEDNYYTNSFSLINASKKALEDMIKPQIDFDINCANLCKIIRNKLGWAYVLRLGSLFKFDEPELIAELGEDSVRLTGYEYDPKTKSITNLIFTNKIYKYNISKGYADLGKKANGTTKILNSLRPIIDDAMMSNNFVGEVLKNGLDMSAYVARGKSISNYIEFNEAGLFMYDQSDMNKAVYIGSSLICITNDKFQTSETAISSEGILAKLLVGSVILGEKLYITSIDGSFYIGNMDEKQGFGLSIKDGNQQQRIFLGTEVDSDGIRRAKLKLIGKDGSLNLSEDGILSELQFNFERNVDSGTPLRCPARLRNNVSSIKSALLNIKLYPFRVYSKGMEGGGGIVKGFTSSDGGAYYNEYARSSDNQNYVNFLSEFATNSTDSGGFHYHAIPKFQFDHFHYFYFTISIPNHSHYTEINIPNHIHQEKYGCFDISNTKPSNIRVSVNGQQVISGINNDTEIDIKAYLIKDRVNEVMIYSDTMGTIIVNLSIEYFKSW